MHFVVLSILIRYKVNPNTVRIVLYTYIVFIFYKVLIQGIHPNFILPEASKNYVGWVGIALGILYYTLAYKKKPQLEIYCALSVLLLSLLTLGRSTILVAMVIFSAVFIQNFSHYRMRTKI